MKFVFPTDNEIPFEIRHYLSEQGYMIEIMEMYAIQPNVFTKEILDITVVVEFLTEHDLSGYLALHYDEEFRWGESYERDKQNMLTRNFNEHRKVQIIAKIDGQVVGSVDVIVEKETAEIDNLYVQPHYQRRGIGTKLQQFVMEQYHDKSILLVADGEDTPREMYTKQGYSYIGKQYSAIKMNLD
ncbi:GNAT family N-acetyltransferase [Lysinibacillus sp. 2017]|uniref:GNAT family N-acetyltransferase n=1 Tax=unclassified Lysinibacillus TaxID=2636778 RepID=UPI000D52A314|nr:MULTISPECIES: GNAT family N-acetyltransferase [unclassified Lysinibacillus]AWE07615.1 GNAT family N-acetyltransferase [Lysinibacillus sp. 2017]TGN36778.1 N-acetyltransferase [Lysinibacillus sp. S2017]